MFQSAHRYAGNLKNRALQASHAQLSQAQRRARALHKDALDASLRAQALGKDASAVAAARAVALGQEALDASARARASIKYEPPDTTLVALVGTALNLLNGTTGPGLLALPLAFARCGWAMGTMLLVFVFTLNHISLLFLLKSCLAAREHSYIGLSARTSDSVAALVDWASLLFFFGSCVSYLVIIGDAFGVATAAWGEGGWYRGDESHHYSHLALGGLVGFTAVCLLPLSLLRSMDSLQPTSALAMVCIAYTVGVVLFSSAPAAAPDAAWDDAEAATEAATEAGGGGGGSARAFDLSSSTLLSLPTMAFCFSSQSLFPPALETLHQPATYHHLHSVVWVTMIATLLIHLAMALGGYLRYGEDVPPNILDALPATTATAVARLAIVLAFAFTYPMMIFLCRMHIGAISARRSRNSHPPPEPPAGALLQADAASEAAASEAADADADADAEAAAADGVGTFGEDDHVVITVGLVALSLVGAALLPNIDQLFGLLGGTTAVVISFVAPALFWEQFVGYMYPWHHPRKLFCQALFVFSALIATLSLPLLVVDLLGNLYATTWWVPMAAAGPSSWAGGWQVDSAAARAWLAAAPGAAGAGGAAAAAVAAATVAGAGKSRGGGGGGGGKPAARDDARELSVAWGRCGAPPLVLAHLSVPGTARASDDFVRELSALLSLPSPNASRSGAAACPGWGLASDACPPSSSSPRCARHEATSWAELQQLLSRAAPRASLLPVVLLREPVARVAAEYAAWQAHDGGGGGGGGARAEYDTYAAALEQPARSRANTSLARFVAQPDCAAHNRQALMLATLPAAASAPPRPRRAVHSSLSLAGRGAALAGDDDPDSHRDDARLLGSARATLARSAAVALAEEPLASLGSLLFRVGATRAPPFFSAACALPSASAHAAAAVAAPNRSRSLAHTAARHTHGMRRLAAAQGAQAAAAAQVGAQCCAALEPRVQRMAAAATAALQQSGKTRTATHDKLDAATEAEIVAKNKVDAALYRQASALWRMQLGEMAAELRRGC